MLNNRSTHPSPFASDQSALVTIPQFSIPGQICLVRSVKSTFPPLTVSFSNSVLFGPVGYFPGRNRPPTKMSKSPSRSKSAAEATDPLTMRSGNVPSGACSYAPLPSFKYNLSFSSSASDSTPPLTTKRSASPSRSASNSIVNSCPRNYCELNLQKFLSMISNLHGYGERQEIQNALSRAQFHQHRLRPYLPRLIQGLNERAYWAVRAAKRNH